MRLWTTLLACCMAAALMHGCSATKRQKILSVFFDGVPESGKAPAASGAEGTRKKDATAPAAVRRYKEHGPYAAKLCRACHEKRTNRLLLPVNELCLGCHPLDLRKKYVHDPVASGSCKDCHEVHRSIHPFLLVSEPRELCFSCHDKETVAGKDAHKGVEEPCTACHDAHGSDEEHLLK